MRRYGERRRGGFGGVGGERSECGVDGVEYFMEWIYWCGLSGGGE